MWREYYKSGKIKRVKTYIDFKLEGEDIRFYESGNAKIKMNHVNDQLQGDWISYYENGAIDQTSQFIDDKREGLFKDFFETGELNFIQVYKNGFKIKEESFYKSGKIKSLYNYNQDGQIDGEVKLYFKNGSLKEDMIYSNDKMISGKTFFNNGNISQVSKKIWSEGGTNNTYDKNGNLIFEEVWNNEKKIWTIPRYPDGGNYLTFSDESNNSKDKDGNPIDINNAFYLTINSYDKLIGADGFLATRFRINDGIIEYKEQEWNVKKEQNGKYVFDGPWITYYDNGKKNKEINFINDEKDGEEKFYDRFGNLTRTVIWNNGIKNNWSMDCSGDECEYVFNSYFRSTDEAKNQGWNLLNNDNERSFIVTDKDDNDYQELYVNNKTSQGFGKFISLPVKNNEDFQVTVTVDWWNGSKNSWFGVVAGWKDRDNYTSLRITQNGYWDVDIEKKGLDIGTTRDDWKQGDRLYSGPTRLNIVRINGNIAFSINSKIVYTSEYSSLEGNDFGIYYSGIQSILFDDFNVRKSISESSPYIAERDDKDSGWSGNGSGIILTKDGYIATNHHIIEDISDIEVEFIYNKEIKSFNAKLIRSDAVNDLAILKIDDAKFANLTSIPYNFKTRSSDIGQEVFALGYPMALTIMGKDIKFTDGRISARSGYQGDITTYQTTTPIQPGNSGGPLFDTNGNLIAINSSILRADVAENVSYSIKTSYLLTLIDALPYSIPLPNSSYVATKSLTEQIKILSNYVVLIKVR